jgi:hypothetical protein
MEGVILIVLMIELTASTALFFTLATSNATTTTEPRLQKMPNISINKPKTTLKMAIVEMVEKEN